LIGIFAYTAFILLHQRRERLTRWRFFYVSQKIHLLYDAGKAPSEKDQKELMDIRKKTEQQLLGSTPDDLFLFNISAD